MLYLFGKSHSNSNQQVQKIPPQLTYEKYVLSYVFDELQSNFLYVYIYYSVFKAPIR